MLQTLIFFFYIIFCLNNCSRKEFFNSDPTGSIFLHVEDFFKNEFLLP